MGPAAKQYREDKAAHERRIFVEFCSASGLAPLSIAQPDPPDIIAELDGRGGAVDRLEKTLAAGDIPRARQEIRDHVGIVTMEADEREIRLYSEQVWICGLQNRPAIRRRSKPV